MRSWPQRLLRACRAAAHSLPRSRPRSILSRSDVSIYQRAADERAEVLERENERLRADLRAAEETLLAVESGMKGTQRGAEAVSKLAEARIQVDRAAKRTPWRTGTAAEAREKLDEAERQLADGHIGSAIFFVSRASRIAAGLDAEADLVNRSPGARNVKTTRVNLRAEPEHGEPRARRADRAAPRLRGRHRGRLGARAHRLGPGGLGAQRPPRHPLTRRTKAQARHLPSNEGREGVAAQVRYARRRPHTSSATGRGHDNRARASPRASVARSGQQVPHFFHPLRTPPSRAPEQQPLPAPASECAQRCATTTQSFPAPFAE